MVVDDLSPSRGAKRRRLSAVTREISMLAT
jgi:hypothetical protein